MCFAVLSVGFVVLNGMTTVNCFLSLIFLGCKCNYLLELYPCLSFTSTQLGIPSFLFPNITW